MKDIVSFDLVEFNPLRDVDRKTEQIALNILAQIIKAVEKKKKFERPLYQNKKKELKVLFYFNLNAGDIPRSIFAAGE